MKSGMEVNENERKTKVTGLPLDTMLRHLRYARHIRLPGISSDRLGIFRLGRLRVRVWSGHGGDTQLHHILSKLPSYGGQGRQLLLQVREKAKETISSYIVNLAGPLLLGALDR